jgi:hypothetical protein
MTRSEGEALIGKLVTAWTAWRGTYVGELVEVLPTRPWRGKIRVVCIGELPAGEFARLIPAGEILEVGGVNIKPFEGTVLSWDESAIDLLAGLERFVSDWERRSAEATQHMRGEASGIAYAKRCLDNVRRQLRPQPVN